MMKPKNKIPKMENFLSTEDKMTLIINIIKSFNHKELQGPSFMDLYRMENNELIVLNEVVNKHFEWEGIDWDDYNQDSEPLPF